MSKDELKKIIIEELTKHKYKRIENYTQENTAIAINGIADNILLKIPDPAITEADIIEVLENNMSDDTGEICEGSFKQIAKEILGKGDKHPKSN